MARTPLMRALQRLAREHREADALGIGPAELRERQAEGAITRRELVKRGGVIGAAVMLGGPAALARPARAAVGWNRSRIAIVGGGIAGLAAALRLQDKGIGSTVYEASDRIGGRMHSDRSGYFSNGQVAEFCGELIDTGHTTIRQLAKRFHLPLTDLLAAEPRGTDDTYWFLGGYYPQSQVDDDFADDLRRAHGRRRRGGLSDALQQLHRGRQGARPHERLRLDRVAGAGRPLLALRTAARRRLHRGVRRRHLAAGVAEPDLPARRTSPTTIKDFSIFGAVRRAVPHRRRQRAAARGDRGLRSPTCAPAGG